MYEAEVRELERKTVSVRRRRVVDRSLGDWVLQPPNVVPSDVLRTLSALLLVERALKVVLKVVSKGGPKPIRLPSSQKILTPDTLSPCPYSRSDAPPSLFPTMGFPRLPTYLAPVLLEMYSPSP